MLGLDPGNKEAVALMREAAKMVQIKAAENSEIKRILDLLEEGKDIEQALKMLISLCSDDMSHTMEFGRRNGHIWLHRFMTSLMPTEGSDALSTSTTHTLTLCIRVLLALSQHSKFVTDYMEVLNNTDEVLLDQGYSAQLLHNDRVTFEGVCSLIERDGRELSRACTSLVLKMMQVWDTHTHIHWFICILMEVNDLYYLVLVLAQW